MRVFRTPAAELENSRNALAGIIHGTGRFLVRVFHTSPETSEHFPESFVERVTKKKSLGDLWCLRMVNKSSHTSHGGISSEEQHGQDREEIGPSQATD